MTTAKTSPGSRAKGNAKVAKPPVAKPAKGSVAKTVKKISTPLPTSAASKPAPRPRRPRAPGRPAGGAPAQREALLDAAQAVFSDTGFAASSLRQIAHQAHVTPALAHYYFSDKVGLLLAVVEERVAPLVAELAKQVGAAAGDPEQALRAFVRFYTRTAATNPWLPQLILREVLSTQGVLRAQFTTRFASTVTALLRAQIVQGQKLGVFRRDLDPACTVMSVLSLCIFPFIATPLVSEVLRIRVDPEHAGTLAEHHLGVLMSGLKEPA